MTLLLTIMSYYSKGKIYKITSKQTEKIYVGSTCESRLKRRLQKHKSNMKEYLEGTRTSYTTSFKILKFVDAKIELIEEYPCESKEELRTRERYWKEELGEFAVNKLNPIRFERDEKEYYEKHRSKIMEKQKEYRLENRDKYVEYSKQYYEENKDELLKKNKEYREKNKEEIKLTKKKYRETHKEQIRKRDKKYREEHKEETKEYIKKYQEENKDKLSEYYKRRWEAIKEKKNAERREKVKCECGIETTKGALSCHKKSKAHKEN
jgi:hypothetical protein